MLDKTSLEGAAADVLIATAIECCRQQQDLLQTEMEDAAVDKFQQLEDIRSFAIQQINWNDAGGLLEHKAALQQLQSLDLHVREQLISSRDQRAAAIRQLRQKRDVSSEYLNFQ